MAAVVPVRTTGLSPRISDKIDLNNSLDLSMGLLYYYENGLMRTGFWSPKLPREPDSR